MAELTAIKKTKKGRYALFLNTDFLFSVDEETLLKHGLHVGLQLDEQQVSELEAQSDFASAKERAFSLLAMRRHSKKELRDKLAEKFDPELADRVMPEIERMGYLDDAGYARDCVESICIRRKMSEREAFFYLLSRGIAEKMIVAALEGYEEGDADRIEALIRSKYHTRLLQPNGERKVYAAMLRRGFRASDIKDALEQIGEQEN